MKLAILEPGGKKREGLPTEIGSMVYALKERDGRGQGGHATTPIFMIIIMLPTPAKIHFVYTLIPHHPIF